MILTLSRHTSNDIVALKAQPFHYVLGLYNILIKQKEEENKQQEEQTGSYSMPHGFSVNGPGGSTSVKL